MSLTVQEKIKDVADKIAKEYKPEKIILFGSYAWGAPTEDSDVDLFIIKDSQDRRIERERAVREIIWGSGMAIDILVYTPEEIKRRLDLEDFFVEDIVKKGKIIYSAK